ncbi:RimJ/RimL family protein N-acetyltransferase [Saccharothrix tamanrassetensis]|uniref:RimJ/RimL family protein N-acetyltransferase n=1 Tax=Saccharothrix tamanrassetensis TaxID=1051531 RepID=A0A841CIN7_9PSEU|nr:GNAT family N-acetyltransferase [Saccharothrix tamanrassetensis]MBB5956224.1 RimJ/RimL family protein N-acetyltransferase [Saccharothrix tamanrassetensis]
MFLETERLALRDFTASDVDALADLHADPAVMRYLEGGRPLDRAAVRGDLLPRYLGATGWWAGVDKATGVLIGAFEFRETEPGVRELGYRLHSRHWGVGYATEVSRALVDNGFRALGVRRVFGTTMAVNAGSRRVLEKAGLRFVRTFFQDWPDPIPGSEQGEVEYALDREDWATTR